MNKNRWKGIFNLVIVSMISVAFLVVPLLFYTNKFSKGVMSDYPSDWAAFSNYMSLFVSFTSFLIISLLTYMLYRYNKKRDWEITEAKNEFSRKEEILERPVIVFRKFQSHSYYTLCNIGKGAALNISIKSCKKELGTHWEFCHNSYSISSTEEIQMIWTNSCIAIAAEYSDIFGNKYGSFMDNDQIRVFKLLDKDDLKKYYVEIEKLNRPSLEISAFQMQGLTI